MCLHYFSFKNKASIMVGTRKLRILLKQDWKLFELSSLMLTTFNLHNSDNLIYYALHGSRHID